MTLCAFPSNCTFRFLSQRESPRPSGVELPQEWTPPRIQSNMESQRRDADRVDESACRHSSVTERRPSRWCDTGLWKEMHFSFFTDTRLASAERLGEESNSPLSLQVPDAMYALDGCGILCKLKSCRLSGHLPEPDIATTRDAQELKERRRAMHPACLLQHLEVRGIVSDVTADTFSLLLNRTNFRCEHYPEQDAQERSFMPASVFLWSNNVQ